MRIFLYLLYFLLPVCVFCVFSFGMLLKMFLIIFESYDPCLPICILDFEKV